MQTHDPEPPDAKSSRPSRAVLGCVLGCVAAPVVLFVVLAIVVAILSRPSVTERVFFAAAKAQENKYDLLEDDKLEDKDPEFDPGLVDSRPVVIARGGAWEINASAAVIKLDIVGTGEKREAYLLDLHPSYADAVKAFSKKGKVVLPSINSIDGKAKQFDDGLYAELDAAFTHQKMKSFHDTSALVIDVMRKLDEGGDAY
ncbi:MAG: hypothetical protein ACYS9X_31450, partial [Planctomycetota bacterium]